MLRGCRSSFMEAGAAPEPGASGKATPPGPVGRVRKLSEELVELRSRFAERSVTLREVLFVLRGRASLLLVILLALPFGAPVSVPGLSTPLGAVIALISFRLALGQKPWLPERLQSWELPPGFFGRVFAVAAGILRLLEKVLRPRAVAFVEAPLLRNLHAVVMLMAACVLLLPIPIPLTNTVPAWVIILVAAGLLERDGLVLAAGYAAFAGGIILFVALGDATHHGFDAIRRWLGAG